MLRKLGLLYRLVRTYCAESGGVFQGLISLTGRVLEIIRFEGFCGLQSRAKQYLGRRVRGYAAADFSEVARERRVFTGRMSAQNGGEVSSEDILSRATSSYTLPHSSVALSQTVDVVVCVHNALDDVKTCFESVERYSDAYCRLVIVDDGSDQETRDFLREYASREDARLIRNDLARGYTFAANQGMKASPGDFVLLLNSDTVVTPGWTEKLVACANSDDSIGLVGPLSNTASWQSIPEIETDGDWAPNHLPEGVSVGTMGKVVSSYSSCLYPRISFLNGFCLLIKREVIDLIGYFDEQTFAKGYGEENDYCLRAREQGYVLAVADDVYIYHSQSKSYGNARRKKLADLAGLALEKKHGSENIASGVTQCRYDKVLMGIRASSKYSVERHRLISTVPGKWAGHRVLFVLPVSEAGGGANVVITEARAMWRMGVQAEILNLSRFKTAFETSYKDLEVPVLYASSTEEVVSIAVSYDVVVATTNYTVQWLQPLEQHADITLAYYIQDYEPLFYDRSDSQYETAYRSYGLIPRMKLFTKTEWNSHEVYKHTGRMPEVIGPSVDVDQFRPRSQYVVDEIARVRVAAMLRPSSPRRNATGTVEVLLELQKRFGRAVDIITFGSESHGPPLPEASIDLNFEDYGHLSPGQTSALLETADIFVDMSTYQAMGLTAMEAMACGSAVVVPQSGGAGSFAVHNVNAVLVDTANPGQVVDELSELVRNVDHRRALQERAIRDINGFYPEKAASNILHYLLPH